METQTIILIFVIVAVFLGLFIMVSYNKKKDDSSEKKEEQKDNNSSTGSEIPSTPSTPSTPSS